MADKKAAPSKSSGVHKPRATTYFTLHDGFNDALKKATADTVARAIDARDRQLTLDDMIGLVIRTANATSHNLTPTAFATVVNQVLNQLVSDKVVEGVLPSSDRIIVTVRRHLASEKTVPE